MKELAIDFDGVIHDYHGWTGDVPQGGPIPGAREAIQELKKDFRIVIFTTRKPEFIRPWLKRYGFDENVSITNEKRSSFTVMLDDRGMNFAGNWETAVKQLKNFCPYWKSPQDPD